MKILYNADTGEQSIIKTNESVALSTVDKVEKKPNSSYTRHYEQIMGGIEYLGITIKKGGLISIPDKLSSDINDVINLIAATRSLQKLTPIPTTTMKCVVEHWYGDWEKKAYKKIQSDIKYDVNAPNNWKDMMKVVFKTDDMLDMWTLQHMIWLIKRTTFGLRVDQSHKPILLNLYGPKGVGKSLFLEEYLLKPLILSEMFDVPSDFSAIINDERQYDVLADNLALIFSEAGKCDKANLEITKNIIDCPSISRRNLGLNSRAKLPNNARLFMTANHRLCENLADPSPRKWYEIDFPIRNEEEIKNYIIERDAIPYLDLWKCVNENESQSSFLQHWDIIQERIENKCGYVSAELLWLYEYFEKHKFLDELVKFEILYNQYCEDNENNKYKVGKISFSKSLKAGGFDMKRKGEKREHCVFCDEKLSKKIEKKLNALREIGEEKI